MSKTKKQAYAAISNEPEWLEAVDYQQKNAAWLRISAEITAHILELLDEREWSKAFLAERIRVKPQQITKLLNGQANLQLSTIAKLQQALGARLIATRFARHWSECDLPEFESAGLMQITREEVQIPVAEVKNAFKALYTTDYLIADSFTQLQSESDEASPLVQAGTTQYAMAA